MFIEVGSTDSKKLIDPIYEYLHSEGQSITGGYVYYGKEHPDLAGSYIYGDFMTGKIWALWKNDKEADVRNVELADTDLMITSFGLTQDGELIIVDYSGMLYKLEEKKN